MEAIDALAASFAPITVVLNILIRLLFAGGIAKDVGLLQSQGRGSRFVSGYVWAFATLVVGIWVVALYWVVHHLTYMPFRDGVQDRRQFTRDI